MTKIEFPSGHNQTDFAAAIMHKIEAENIAVHNRAWFLLHDAAFWSLWFLSALIGALGLSATMFVLKSSDWRWYTVTHESLFAFATDVMPSLWLSLFVVMCLLAYLNLRHTPRGYRYSSGLLIALNLVATVMLSVLLAIAGTGKFVDEQIGKHLPRYVPVMHKQEMHWSKPQDGLLIGKVTHVDQVAQIFILESWEASEMNVDGHLLSLEEWELLGLPRAKVRVIGIPHDSSPFVACIVLPVLPNGLMPMKLDYVERIFSEPRSIECRGVKPYDRFDQFKPW